MTTDPAAVRYRFSYAEAESDLGVDAQTAGQELDRIRRRDGTIAPRVVVNESRPAGAPLHPVFEWRDEVAAERFREHQAKQLITVVRVVTPAPTPAAAPRRLAPQPKAASQPLQVDRHDPFETVLSEVVGQMVEAERRLESMRMRAQRTFERQRMIQLQVAINALHEAHEALLLARGGSRQRVAA